MRKITVTAGALTAGSANAISLSQTPTSALTINGALATSGVAYLLTPRRVLITTTGNETGKNFTITGTNQSGNVIREILAGVNNTTTQSVLDYFTVTSITISAAAAAALTVGTSAVGGSPWVRMDEWALSSVSIQCNVSGTVNYTVQQTLDDPNNPTSPVDPSLITWMNSADATLVGASTNIQSNSIYLPVYYRVMINSGTGTVTATFDQTGSVVR